MFGAVVSISPRSDGSDGSDTNKNASTSTSVDVWQYEADGVKKLFTAKKETPRKENEFDCTNLPVETLAQERIVVRKKVKHNFHLLRNKMASVMNTQLFKFVVFLLQNIAFLFYVDYFMHTSNKNIFYKKSRMVFFMLVVLAHHAGIMFIVKHNLGNLLYPEVLYHKIRTNIKTCLTMSLDEMIDNTCDLIEYYLLRNFFYFSHEKVEKIKYNKNYTNNKKHE